MRTGIWKDPVRGRCRVGRFNLDGDGQADLAGHGGEQRAVFVYQIALALSPTPSPSAAERVCYESECRSIRCLRGSTSIDIRWTRNQMTLFV